MRSRNLAIAFVTIGARAGRRVAVEKLLRSFGGRRIKSALGTLLFAFDSPSQALACLSALRERLLAEGAPLSAGVNFGEVRLDAGDVFGDAVNVAARVHALALPGEVLFTEALWLSMDRSTAQAVALGARELKGVPEPVQVFRLERSLGCSSAQNLVLLLSDMKGYTARTSRQSREENERMLALHDSLLKVVVKRFGGRRLKSIGDALLAGFTSPTDAALCATAIQDRLAGWNARQPAGEAIEVRIALAQGEIRRAGGDVQGEPLRLAVAACAQARPGAVVLTSAVYLSMNKREVPTEPMGDGLRRVHASSDERSPYGGAALRRLGRLPEPLRAWAVRRTFTRALLQVRRRSAWAAALLVLAGAAVGERARASSPLARAEQLLAARQPLAALAELDKFADSPEARSPRVALTRGKAEQALGQLGLAFSDFAVALDAGTTDPEVMRALADDLDAESFPSAWRSSLLQLLAGKAGKAAAPALRPLLQSPRGRTRESALAVLELSGAATDADRLAASQAELADPATPCPARLAAIRRLALVEDPRKGELLRRAAAARGCGAREASDAVRRLSRSELADKLGL